MKGSFDINSKEDCAKVAKCILDAANRPVETAARAFGGYPVMVLGADKGRLGGVSEGIETLALEQKLGAHLGLLAHSGILNDILPTSPKRRHCSF